MIVIRLQTIVSREVAPNETVVPDRRQHPGRYQEQRDRRPCGAGAEPSYLRRGGAYGGARRDPANRGDAECQASDSPREPEFELYDSFPLTVNDAEVTARVEAAFGEYFGDRAQSMPAASASEDFSEIPAGAGGAVHLLGHRRHRRRRPTARQRPRDRVRADVPVNHSPRFAPVLQPTLDTGTEALVVAGLSWL